MTEQTKITERTEDSRPPYVQVIPSVPYSHSHSFVRRFCNRRESAMTSQAITLNAGANGNQTSTANMIELEGVEKVYRTDRIETVALANVNLAVREGEFISIMGPSGSGKSTLLNVIGLLDVPSGGKVSLNRQHITSYSDRNLARVRNEEIGFIFQTFHLINDLSVVDNVEIPLLYRKLSNSERRKRALRALDRVGLNSRVHHFPSQLSGGQQQRVAIAR